MLRWIERITADGPVTFISDRPGLRALRIVKGVPVPRGGLYTAVYLPDGTELERPKGSPLEITEVAPGLVEVTATFLARSENVTSYAAMGGSPTPGIA